MPKKIYKKLIRDKIPEIIKAKNGMPRISVLSKTDFKKALKSKMAEETKELLKAKSKSDVLNELSDIQELIMAIAENYKISMNEIEKYRKRKLQKRGGFRKKLFLEYVDE